MMIMLMIEEIVKDSLVWACVGIAVMSLVCTWKAASK